jgi:bifunctional non-homologous end joining protein LigD
MEKRRSESRLLRTYRAKRDFTNTEEPKGDEDAPSTGHAFVVQKHAASHLHYDFRLEMDGVLKSWAVAKGPSVDPAVKRLAIQVEDHPLAYGRFEGNIPKGEYGGGTVMLWDRGTWHPIGDAHAGYTAGRLKFRLSGDKMKGQWALVRMKARPNDRNPNWLLVKDRDEDAAPGDADKLLMQDKSVKTGREMEDIAATRSSVWIANRSTSKKPKTPHKRTRLSPVKSEKMPAFIEPQLATRVDKPPADGSWLHEIKFDGYRLHARLENGRAKILTRHGEDWTAKFPGLTKALQKLPVETAYIDGEAAILNEAGISDFSALQTWFKTPGKRTLVYFAFDLIYLNGKDLRRLPLLSRKELLRDLVQRSESDELRYSDHQLGSGPAFFAASAGLQVEGIISKTADAPYVSGRTRSWLKIKQINRQEFVVGGYTLSSNAGDAIGALLLGEYDKGRLVYVGKVGTGFSAADIKSLFKKLAALGFEKSPFEKVPPEVRKTAHWVKPELVAEIEFGAWTSDHILRHSTFLGLREDKDVRDVKREEPMPVREAVKSRAATVKSARAKPSSKSKSKDGALVVGVNISHPERPIYPAERITKLDVARYYEAVADVMLPHIARRPLSLVRCPDGIGPACFFQKHAGAGLPESIHEQRVGDRKQDTVLTIDSAEGLVALVQRGVLEVHVWGSHLEKIETPDLLVFDFDPDPSVKWKKVVQASLDMRDTLEDLGLKSFIKTTGGKGLHVVVPLKPLLDWDGIKQFTKAVAAHFAARDPATFLINMSKKARQGRIFVDYLRNGRGATAVAPYSTRARPKAPVATPISWKEIEDGAEPLDFTVMTVPKRVARGFKDPWKGMQTMKQQITVKMIAALAGKKN